VKLVVGHEEILGPWAAERIKHLFLDSLGPFRTFGIVDEDGYIRGVALYHGYAPRYASIEISFALDGPRWLTAPVIAGILSYPFEQLGCGRVTAVTRSKKPGAAAARFLSKFGFKREGLARRGFGEFGDALIFGLTRRDWQESPFNRRARLNGKEVRPDAAACA
jgi:RimJ/RimL family protein N-acetyltransferase